MAISAYLASLTSKVNLFHFPQQYKIRVFQRSSSAFLHQLSGLSLSVFHKNRNSNQRGMEKDGITVIEIWASSDEEELEERHRRSSISSAAKGSSNSVTIKDEFKIKKKITKEFDDDCFILDYDPFDSLKKLSINDKQEKEEDADDDDLSVIAERGQVACRDFPHSRHLCVKFPFRTTPHSSHCEQCYCYVCDTIAPCKFWSDGAHEHCHATADEFKWKVLRQAGKTISSSTQGNLLGI